MLFFLQSILWKTSGELRFLMLKRAMDVFYASVEAAMEVTHARSASDWQLLGATAAAASFYSTPGTGASKRVVAITSSSQAAGDLIRNAWGMVSLTAVKNLSLHASRFLKGASVADRIEICGVPCFVLSKDPAPELATSIDSFKRMTGMTTAPSLATIEEEEEHTPRASCSLKPFARSPSLSRFRQRDVIFHLTGGGFFAHIIATDLPYLLDWSSATGAIIICPEYCLLPDHCFPDALNQITNVYRTLVSNDATSQLGFEVNRIVVTGESAGGNLAAALCIQLSHQLIAHEIGQVQIDGHIAAIAGAPDNDITCCPQFIRFPDALMLSCPVLNLSSDLSPSRMASTQDPVMPGSVISAISDAYIPSRLGVSRKDPLVSPIYASDDSLKHFPPTLLFASSNDPVLDDSVIFNRRLQSLGVDSKLQVADNLPHAYFGLGITAFPEAVQVQKDCQNWLVYQLTRKHFLEDDISSGSW
jgi:acetyl esterase/lipase